PTTSTAPLCCATRWRCSTEASEVRMRVDWIWGLLATLPLAGCAKEGPPALVGTIEWDRIAVTAELAEPVMRWAVAEGDRVEAGAVLLELDPRRQDARIAEARGNLMMNEGKLTELTHGARIETIDAARANLASAHAAETDAEADYTR